MKKISLNSGMTLPEIGFGSPIVLRYRYGDFGKKDCCKYWIKNAIKNRKQLRMDWKLGSVIDAAMKNGCTMFDTSSAYAGSEMILGKTLKKYERNQYQICTKISNKSQFEGNIRESFCNSLKSLRTNYVDVLLIHWPVEGHYLDTWRCMEQLYKEGLCKAIGVCNCNIHHLDSILEIADVKPTINQFECHPLFTQDELREYCKKNGIQVMAYTPTARMDDRLINSILLDISRKYRRSIAQIILRWHIQIGNIPIVNSMNYKHLKENFNIFDFNLSKEEVEQISAININSRLRYDPDHCDFRRL